LIQVSSGFTSEMWWRDPGPASPACRINVAGKEGLCEWNRLIESSYVGGSGIDSLSRATGREGQRLGEAWPTPGKRRSIACRAGWMDHRNRHARRAEHQLPDDQHRPRLALQAIQQERDSRRTRNSRPRQRARPLAHPHPSRPVELPKAIMGLKWPVFIGYPANHDWRE